jgi:hypothetical protein
MTMAMYQILSVVTFLAIVDSLTPTLAGAIHRLAADVRRILLINVLQC